MKTRTIKPTNENFDLYGVPVVTKWLIEAALARTTITYGEVLDRLENEIGFMNIVFPTRIGYIAGALMHRIYMRDKNAPLLNALLVGQRSNIPGAGIGSFLANHFHKPELARPKAISNEPKLWLEYSQAARAEVYDFLDWPRVYKKVFGEDFEAVSEGLPASSPKAGTEKDGLPRGRGGEGPNHKALRLWVQANPKEIFPKLTVLRSETEVDLLSGDRVDVVYYASPETVALEVKSMDSNDADLTRGIYQCVKYRAVLRAMHPDKNANITAILVTEKELPGYLSALAKRLAVPHKLVSPKKDT